MATGSTPLSPNPSECQEISGSWMNLSTHHEAKVNFPRRIRDILPTLRLKLAILSGGRDENGREIITFPAKPRGFEYNHSKLLQTLQYLSIVPSPEACELGFAIIVDGRALSWAEIKLILRTSQEALPGQVHIAYVVQPTQFVHRQQMSMALSKEKDKLEYAIVKVNSIEKLLRHIDSRQVTFDLGGVLGYKHDEWLDLRTKLEDLTDTYQTYSEKAAELESHFKDDFTPPEKLLDLQKELSTVEALKPQIESADESVKQLGADLKTFIETISGSIGMTPEMVNCLAKVNRILTIVSQQRYSLLELYEERHRSLSQSYSLKQFDLGLTKVVHWIKSKGMSEVCSVDIGDSLATAQSLKEKLQKLGTKVESMAEDVTELKRMADVMLGSEHFDRDKVKTKLSKMNAKHSKFMSIYEQRKTLTTRAVAMYTALEEWRQLYDKLSVEWTRVKNTETETGSADQLIQSLEAQHQNLKESAQTVLKEGQELVKALKQSGVSQGDPEFRRSLRYISRTTEEVTDKSRRSQEMASAKHARLDQYSQLLLCEQDGQESIRKLQTLLSIMESKLDDVGRSLEETKLQLNELQQSKEEFEHTKEYATRLLQSALQQRQLLRVEIQPNLSLQSELDQVSHQLQDKLKALENQLKLTQNFQALYERNEAIVQHWTNGTVTSTSSVTNDELAVEIEERGKEVISSFDECLQLGTQLKKMLLSGGSSEILKQSVSDIDKLTESVARQKSTLLRMLSQRKDELKSHGRLATIEQSAEDLLIWLREHGLPKLTEFCSLEFTLKAVEEQRTKFLSFQETCNDLTAQIDILSEDIQKEQRESLNERSTLTRVSKRVTDLQNLWKRFLIRIQNRERAISSLHQFLNEAMKVTSAMSEYLHSSSTHYDKSVLELSYQSTLAEGSKLIDLLQYSPDGTQDSYVADQVAERMGELSHLHDQLVPLINGIDSTANGSSHEDVIVQNGSKNKLPKTLVNNQKELTANGNHLESISTPMSLPEPSHNLDDFQVLEENTDKLLQKLLQCISNFLKAHSVFPSTVVDAEMEHIEHKDFLNSIQTSIAELHTMADSLKTYTTSRAKKNKVLYLVDRIDGRVQERVSIIEKRIGALDLMCQLHSMNTECHKKRERLDKLISNPHDPNLSDEDARELLDQYNAQLAQLDSAVEKYVTETHSFTSVSSELETSGADARRTVRGMLRKLEESVSATHKKRSKWKSELEMILKKSGTDLKLRKLLLWVTEVGLPFVSVITLGTSLEESKVLFEEVQQFAKKAKDVTDDITGTLNDAKRLLTQSTGVKETAQTQNLFAELKSNHEMFQEKLSNRQKTLKTTHDFFKSGDALLFELSVVLDPLASPTDTFNPIVAEKLYTVLCAQAKQVCQLAQAHLDTQPTIISANNILRKVDEKISTYLVICKKAAEDLEVSLLELDNLLKEIEANVQEEIFIATGQKDNLHSEPTKSSKAQQRLGAFQDLHSRRRGSVLELKKKFESPTSITSSPLPQKKTSLHSVAPEKPLSAPATPITSSRRISTSSHVIVQEPKSATVKTSFHDFKGSDVFVPASPASTMTPPPPTPPPPSKEKVHLIHSFDSKANHIESPISTPPPPTPPPPKEIEPPVRPPLPIESESSDSAPPTPPPPSIISTRTSPPADMLTSESDSAPPVLSLPPIRPRPSPPADTPYTDYKSKNEITEQFIENLSSQSSSGSMSPHDEEKENLEANSSQSSIEELADVRYDSPDPPVIQPVESDHHGNSNGHFNEWLFIDEESTLQLERDEEEDAFQEEFPRARILSPVFEELDEEGDRPDIGWSSFPHRSKRIGSDERAQWVQAHKQSLQSMRAILSDFYTDEIEYTKTVNKLVQVYSPILQYTGAFVHLSDLADFQTFFMEQITASVSDIPTLCKCFQENMNSFKLYFPYVINYDNSLNALSICKSEELAVLTQNEATSDSELIVDYSAPYQRLEIYCNLFQQLLQAAYKEDLMSLAALSETLESLLNILKLLSIELITSKLQNCPFSIKASDIITTNPFLVHLANREREVLMYTCFLHPDAIVLAERRLNDSKDRIYYEYIMHIPTSGLLLIKNYHGLYDRFAVCERGQTSQENIVVFRACEDTSVKDFWVIELDKILKNQANELTPQEALQPEQVEELAYLIPKTAPPPPAPSDRLQPLRHKGRKRFSKTSQDSIDGYEDIHTASDYTNIHRVVMDHTAPPGNPYNYLSVQEGDLVDVIEEKGLNYLVITIPLESSDKEEEGYIPQCCVEPIYQQEEISQLNLNSNNSHEILSPVRLERVIQPYKDNDYPNSEEEFYSESDSNNDEEEISPSQTELHNDWMSFCAKIGHFVSFPNCHTEGELLQAKMEVLIRYHSSLGEPNKSIASEDWVDKPHDISSLPNTKRKQLYEASFLGNEEPSNAQLTGLFALRHPYVTTEPIEASDTYQLSLRGGQLVKILDSKRDDWWLVSTFPEGEIAPEEGWVQRHLLQHPEYIREEVTDESASNPPFTVPALWLVLEDYLAAENGTISVTREELVEVIDNAHNCWSLVRTIGRQPREGWIPTEFIKPYNFSDHQESGSPLIAGPIIRPGSAGAESSSTEGVFDSPSPLSPCLSIGELTDEDKRREAAEYRDFTLSEFLQTEKQYLERLEYCLLNYKATIEGSNTLVPKSLKSVSDELFGNIQDIYNYHKQEMLPQLKHCKKDPNNIVDLFALSGPQLKALYVTYCRGKHRSEDIYQDHIEYLQELRDQLKDRLSLRDYLILPIQRITKYNLLLKNYLESSIKAGTPVQHFESALAVTHDISRQANNAVHLSMIEGIQKRLDEFGELVLQDSFSVCETQHRIFKERRVFLFEKALAITKRRRDSSERETYVNKEIFMLQDISISGDMDIEKRNIVIYDISTGNKFTLKAMQSKLRDEWLTKATELLAVAKRATTALSLMGMSKIRSVSEPDDLTRQLNVAATAGALSLLRQGSQRLRRSGRAGSRPSSASSVRERKPQPGTHYVVIECIVLEGGDDFQLDPGEIVELVRVEPSGSLRVRTTDELQIEGTVPPGFLRKKDAIREGGMETAPRVTVSPSDQTMFLHDSVSISCAFNGTPPPVVVWKRDDDIISQEDNLRIRISSCATSSVLQIHDLEYSDEGQYSCTVSNVFGTDTTIMDLFVEGLPLPPSKPVASRATTTSVKLRWNPPEHDGHNPITSYLVEQLQEGMDEWKPIVQQPKTVFVVRTLDPNTWYQFRVIANNENGSSDPSPPSDKVYTTKNKKWPVVSSMSPATRRRFLETELNREERESNLLTPTFHGSMDDLSRSSSACLLDGPEVSIREDSVNTYYDLLPDELGRGRFGIIQKCIHKHTGSLLAAKYLKRNNEASKEVRLLQSLSTGSCSNILEFVDALTTNSNIVIITELLFGGELIDWILTEDYLTEALVIEYIQQLLYALEYINERNVVHLDIKPENVLLTSEILPTLKLIDFGSAQELSCPTKMIKPDSLEFTAPEIIAEKHINKSADLWSVGVLVYILLSGVSPFFSDSSITNVSQRLMEAQYDFSQPSFQHISHEAKDFILSLLRKNPLERLSARTALEHTWIKTLATATEKQTVTSRLDLSKLRAFQARRKLHVSAKAAKTTSIFNSHHHRYLASPYSNVLEFPPIFEEGTEEVRAPVGASVTLEWFYKGHPEPSVVWEHNERKVVSSDRTHIANHQGLTQLMITGVVRADDGLYTCCILNSLGSDIQKCQLVVIDKPAAPSSITGLLLGSSTSALISWRPPVYEGNSPITHYILEQRQIDYEEWEVVNDKICASAHVVEHLLPGKTYVFRVASVNALGLSPFSKSSSPVLISVEEDSPTSSPLVTDLQMRHLDFNLEYELGLKLEKGQFSAVYECRERTTDRYFVAKFFECNTEYDRQIAVKEFEMLKKVKHPRIAQLEDAISTPTHLILVLELVPCGNLLSFVTPSNPLDEHQTARFVRHITEALEYLHSHNIILINIAPENLLLGAAHQEIKLVDFSLARYVETGNNLDSLPANIHYMAPEAVQLQPLTKTVDMWSLGAVALFMLSGYCPFIGETTDSIIADIQALQINIQCDDVISMLSADCSDVLFDGLLVINPRKRLSSHQCQRHRWLQSSSVTVLPGLRHMNTEEQVEYFKQKYPSHFHLSFEPS